MQDTGLSRLYPIGDGLFTFRSIADVQRAFATIEADYRHHCESARALAQEHFAAERVLGRLLHDAGIA